ncbi:MAG TPA: hypothetical protein VJS43_11155 [Candidatus Acidoferrales bacterium]|nr:hypothetical protein [Candidatus Acidoferrales bacterium]
MRLTGIALAILLFGAGTASAQTVSEGALLVAAPTPSINRAVARPLFSSALRGALLNSARPAPAPAPQEIEGVFPAYYWQTSFGFTYTRFYEVPGTVVATNGFNASMAYFFKPWMAAEGVIDAGVGKQLGQSVQSVFTGGGLRLSASQNDALNLWIHADAGEAHFSPKTSFGGENALGYEAGGGVDISPRHHKLAYRLGVDMLGTSFFGTYQISPKISAGIVYKF